MAGSIDSGDIVEVEPVQVGQLWRGDIVLFERNGRLLAHRLIGFLNDDAAQGLRLVFRGDNHSDCDQPVPAAAILGRVVHVERNLPERVLDLGRLMFGLLGRDWLFARR